MEAEASNKKIIISQAYEPDRSPSALGWRILLRILASGGLVWLLLRKISGAEFLALWSLTINHWIFLGFAFVMPLIGVVINAMRLRILLEAQSVSPPVIELCKANLVGAFYNQIFPSTIGGDVARGFWIGRMKAFSVNNMSPGESILVSFTVIGLDRLIGCLGIMVTGLLAAIAKPSIIGQAPGLKVVIPLIVGGVVVLVLLPFIQGRSVGRWMFSMPVLRKLREKAVMIYRTLKAYHERRHNIVAAFLLSLGLQFTIIAQYWILATALQINVSIWALAVLVPIVSLISMLPITINGIGIRENALYVLGATLGFTAVSAVALAWAFLVSKLFWAMIGALVHLQARPKQ